MKHTLLHRWLLASVLALQLLWVAPAFFAVGPDAPRVVPQAFAQDAPSTSLESGGSGLSIPTGDTTLSSAISQKSLSANVISIVNYFIGFLGLVATVFIIYAGVLMIVSAGDEEALTKGKKIMTYSAIGFVIIMLSFSIVRFIAGAAPGGGTGTQGTTEVKCGDQICAAGESCGVNTANEPVCLPNTTPRTACSIDGDCPQGQVCGGDLFCKRDERGSVTSDPAVPAVNENIDKVDTLMEGLEDKLDTSGVTGSDKAKIDTALASGNLDNKIDALKALRDDPATGASLSAVLDRLIDGLEKLKSLREELDLLRANMPESKDLIKAYDATSKALDQLILAPTDKVQFRRFENEYKSLKELIRKFPLVQAKIRAIPGEGNVPFTVQFDGLDSFDPSGGTVTDYRWSLTDPSGNDVSLGNQSVALYEFTQANSYAVHLRVSTSQKDADGYRTATDGVAVIRIRANPPASQVKFRINGTEAYDLFHTTLDSAQAGLSFDPSLTTPALGRVINRYEWFFGDSAGEVRLAPTAVVHSYDKPGDYFVKLEVTDNIGIKDKRIVKILVKSLAAEINLAPATGSVNTEFTFSGSRSRSDDGFIKNYEWDIQDKSGKTVADSLEESFKHTFATPGLYKINLTVTDLTGAKDKIVQELTVASRPPVASFTASVPQQNHPAEVEFNAVDSYDPDEGDSLTYSWDFDGDKTFDVTNSKEATTLYQYKRKGEFKATLQVEDSFGLRATLEKKVSVDSVLAADIGLDRRTARVGDVVKFTAEKSNAVAYLWEFGDGETESTEKLSTTHTYAKAGKFMVKMNFFDANDQEGYDSQRLLVGSGDKPMAVISATVNGREPALIDDLCGAGKQGAIITRADIVRFDAKSSINTDGSSRLLNYDWRFPNGEKISTRETSYKFADVGREGQCFTVSLVVRDQISGKISDEDIAQFRIINQLPVITDFVITAPPAERLITPTKILLRAINPKDMDGTIKKYKWYYTREGAESERLGLHNTATPETEMVITSIGEPEVTNRYFFNLEVVDNDNGVYNTQERFGEVSYLDIKNGPNLSPVTEFTLDKTTITVGDSITFISTSYDPQGDTLPNDAFRWDFDGDGTFDDTTSGPQVNRQFNTPGEYETRLKVIYRGLSSSASHKVVVESANALPQAAFTYTIDGNEVNFDASSTRFDPALSDPTLRFEWDFNTDEDSNGNGLKDDDIQSTEMRASTTYNERGLYRVRLKVKDSLGMEGVVVREINLNETEAERNKNTLRTLKLTSPSMPLTSLEITAIPATLNKGGSADLTALVLNADNSPYTGKVYFEVLEGSGIFSPNPVDAKDSKATSVFNASDAGKVRIRVRATDTLYGEMVEEATLNVR
ncbi:PKD domain-containing protein [Candidatus Peregrinibacteria bacterium]|nr:PKD domain-containing protein [Candidatus Peregrinibacteria bacterium]